MIGSIEGIVSHKDEHGLVLAVHGVGYQIAVATPVLEKITIGDSLFLSTHLSVREDALDLYGFRTREELAFFRLLIGISGIGPKSALNILSLADIATLTRAIKVSDSVYLTKVSGIGKKLAAKIILELKEKVGVLDGEEVGLSTEHEAIEALEALGYLPRDTRDIVHALAREQATAQEIIRGALRQLGRQQGGNFA